MDDEYTNYSKLSASEVECLDYQRRLKRRDSNIAVIAPHGGSIEPGTSEIAEAIANEVYSLYCFEGIKRNDNQTLHITSKLFDEPMCIELVSRASIVIAVHGLEGTNDVVQVGGLDKEIGTKIREALIEAGFTAIIDISSHSGADPGNICNRGSIGKGIQLEITEGLRKKMFLGLNRRGRRFKKPAFHTFVDAVRKALFEGYSSLAEPDI
jgi:phage replication-related protein YjqB (UPF0714/DUF867 family)